MAAPQVGAGGLLGNWLDGWAVAATGILDCFAAALIKGPAALDIPRWLEVSTGRRRPRWSSPHDVLVNLIGDCQGGWLAAIYAALHPERVNTLTLAGAPIDFHAGDPVIHEALLRLSPGGDLRFYEALVRSGGHVLKGEHMLSGFIMLKPGDEISRQLELLANLGDAAHVERYRGVRDWFKHTQDIPGAFYLWIVRHLFRDNELVHGRLEIGGRRVDLRSLEMPLHLLAGAVDPITPPNQLFAIAHHASTPDELVRRDVVPGGHLGLFMSHQSLREHWPPMLGHVLRFSAPSSPRRTYAGSRAADGRPTSK